MSKVAQNGFALQFASDELKADRNVVLAAVRLAKAQLFVDHRVVSDIAY